MTLIETVSSSPVSVDARVRFGGKTATRFMLLGTCAAVTAVGFLMGVGETGVKAADPNLALLLEAMLAMKAALALIGFAAVWWRFGSAASMTVTAGYIGGAALMALGSALLSKGGGFMTAGTVFHAGILVLLVLAWRDGFDRNGDAHSGALKP